MNKQYSIIDGNNFIGHHLKECKPFAAGKIGITELNLIYCTMQGKYPHNIIEDATNIAGIYPYEDFNKFIEIYMKYLKDLDIMSIWNKIIPQLEMTICKDIDAYPMRLQDVEPYFFENPWSKKLENKKVLVISPFTDSVSKQYVNKDKIWNRPILPDFELKTIKYPHAKTTNPDSPYNSTIDAMNSIMDQMDKINYDVAIVGCGGASIPLTVHAKRQGKAGIHMGGSLQILFGIKGARWDNIPEISKFYNEYWVRPSGDEIPPKKQLVEGGCYW